METRVCPIKRWVEVYKDLPKGSDYVRRSNETKGDESAIVDVEEFLTTETEETLHKTL